MPRFNDQKEHYESLTSYFKTLVGITSTALTIIAGVAAYFTYSSGQDMRDDIAKQKAEMKEATKEMQEEFKSKQQFMSEQLSLLSIRANDQITFTRETALNEISNIKTTSAQLAENEARQKINEVFDNRNLNDFITKVAQERIETKVNVLVDNQIDFNNKKQLERAFNDLKSQDRIKINSAILYLKVNIKADFTDSQIQVLVNLLDSGNFIDNSESINEILVVRISPIIEKYYKTILDKFANKTLITNQYNIYTLLAAYQYFLTYDVDYNYIVNHFKAKMRLETNNSKIESTIGFLPNICKYSKNYTKRLLNDKGLIDEVLVDIQKEYIPNIEGITIPLLKSCLDDETIDNSYFVKAVKASSKK